MDIWQQLRVNVTVAPKLDFIAFADKVYSMSASMPLLLHNWKEIIELWLSQLYLQLK
jgi:U3 small nucleolar RNA-associated protein 20